MITKINTFEGVPIGGNNFEDFLSYMRNYLSANFAFSTGATGNNGGYFLPDDFVFTKKSASGVPLTHSAFFIGPATKDVGSLFGTNNNEFYRFDIINSVSEEPQIYEWTLLATDTSTSNDGELLYRNISTAVPRKLPYRPIKFASGTYSPGYREVRLNGVPQEDFTFSANLVSNFREQELSFTSLRLAPELPKPVLNRRFDSNLSLDDTITKSQLISDYNSRLTFEFTNFALEGGGHIILYKPDNDAMVYLPRDTSGAPTATIGTYRVVDYARGVIELNPSNAQLESLRITGEVGNADSVVKFTVLSAEQLLEETVNGVTRYHSRYGSIYDGDISSAMLVEYIFDGNNHIISEIPNTEYVGTPGSIILSDVNNNYTDGLVLAVFYNGVISQSSLEEVQSLRYLPDTFQLYFHIGGFDLTSADGDNFRAIVEINPSSWYNQEIVNVGYSPVNRVEEAYYFLIDSSEVPTWSENFNPSESFEIVDTIGLENLADVGTVVENDVLVYNGSSFDGVQFSLANLIDTNISPSIATNHVLQWNGSAWINRTVTNALTASGITSPIFYSGNLSLNANSNYLTHRKYVDDKIAADISTHNSSANVHGATSEATPDTIMKRNGLGWSKAKIDSSLLNLTNAGLSANKDWLINVGWIHDISSSFGTTNKLVKTDNNGNFSAATPTSLSHVATKGYVDDQFDRSVSIDFGSVSHFSINNLNQFGRVKLGGDLWLQWCSPAVNENVETTYSRVWPQAFTNLFSVQVTTITATSANSGGTILGINDKMFQLYTATNSSVTVYLQRFHLASGDPASHNVSCIVWGIGTI